MQNELGRAYHRQAVALATANQLTEAKKLLSQSLSLKPALWQAWNVLGLCCYGLGEFALAKEAWERSLTFEPQANSAEKYLATFEEPAFKKIQERYHSALAAAHCGNYQLAARILKNEVLPTGETVTFYNLLGLCHYAQGQLAPAREAWSQALRLDNTNPLTLRYLREAQSLKKEPTCSMKISRWFENILHK